VLDAVRKWRFKPARAADGTPVPARIALPVEISSREDQ
jgi:outer membrane biosynthesis protein TonB